MRKHTVFTLFLLIAVRDVAAASDASTDAAIDDAGADAIGFDAQADVDAGNTPSDAPSTTTTDVHCPWPTCGFDDGGATPTGGCSCDVAAGSVRDYGSVLLIVLACFAGTRRRRL